MIPGYDGRNRTFFLVNYEGTRIDRGATNFYTVPTPQELAGRFSTPIIDPRDRHAVPEQHHSAVAILAAGAAGHPEQLVSRRRTHRPRRVTTRPFGRFRRCRTSSRFAGTRISAKFGRVFVRYTKTAYENTNASNLIEAGDRVFVQDTKNWQVSHSWPIRNTLVNQFRIGRVDARADQHGIPCAQGDVDFLNVTGVFTNIPDDQRECPSIGMDGYSGTGGAVNAYTASNQPMWDISNTTTWVRGSHTLNFGCQLSPLVAAARPGHRVPRKLRVQRRVHRQSGRRHAARILLGRRACSSRRRSASQAQRATRASSTSSTLRRTSRTTGASTRS